MKTKILISIICVCSLFKMQAHQAQEECERVCSLTNVDLRKVADTVFVAADNSLGFHSTIKSEEKTYIIEINWSTLHSVEMSWYRTDGFSDKDNDLPYTLYYGEYGIKGFERGKICSHDTGYDSRRNECNPRQGEIYRAS